MSSLRLLGPLVAVVAVVHADHYHAPARIWGPRSKPAGIQSTTPANLRFVFGTARTPTPTVRTAPARPATAHPRGPATGSRR